jgi:CRP-like cAMP-binding protein
VEERLEPPRVPAGAMLFTRGDRGDRNFVQAEGLVEAYLPAELGRLGGPPGAGGPA